MRLARYLKPEQIKLELAALPAEEVSEEAHPDKRKWAVKDAVLEEIVTLLDASGKVSNRSKLLTDLQNRERKATTAVGGGIAIPHVRTMQIRELTLAFARSTAGIDFDSPDGLAVHLFVAIVCPSYEDADYAKVLRRVAEILSQQELRQQLMSATNEHEVIRVIELGH